MIGFQKAACGVPAVPFITTALQEYHPEILGVIEKVLGGVLREEELDWLDMLRTARKAQPNAVDSDLWTAMYMLATYLSRRRV